MKLRKFVVIFYLHWVDTSEPHIQQLQAFLQAHGISAGRIYRLKSQHAYSLRISKTSSVLEVAKRLMHLTYKKRSELQIVIDYYTNHITGNEAVARMNAEVVSGSRSAGLVKADLPLARTEGKKLALVRARGARKLGRKKPSKSRPT